MEQLNFRNLQAQEIEVRVAQVNKGGVMLLLYKDARCDQNILDETVGATNWQRHHSRDNANCTVAIWDSEKSQWIEKEDTGVKSNTQEEKGLASDSFKRACVNWGIGRELYTSPRIFISKDKLKHYSDEGGKASCRDEFKVSEITYFPNTKVIQTVRIDLCEYGKKYASASFSNNAEDVAIASTATAAPKAPESTAPTVKVTKAPAAKTQETAQSADGRDITDETVILIGNCRGKKYGNVKGSKEFASLLKWILTASGTYEDEERRSQFRELKKLAQQANSNGGR